MSDAKKEASSTALAEPEEETQLATPMDGDDIQGDIDATDLNLPKINVVQKVGEISDLGFDFGALIYNREVLLSNGEEPVPMIVFDLKVDLVQDLPFNSEETPAIYDTKKEVLDAGGSFEYGSDFYFRERGTMTVLTGTTGDTPEEMKETLPFEHKGVNYALAKFTVGKSSYKSMCNPLLVQRRVGLLRTKGLAAGLWNVTTVTKKWQGNTYVNPVAKFKGLLPDDMVGFIQEIRGE